MLIATTSARAAIAREESAGHRTRSVVLEVVFWLAAIVLAFVVPPAIVLAAIVISSYGIPLPIEVRVP